jgi:hypothetical protein
MGVIADFIIATEPEALEQVAADWAATEEMQWDQEETRGLIDELAQHAVRASRAGKPMYLWNCV